VTTSPLILTSAAGAVLRVTSARLLHFYQGAWSVDAELEPESLAVNGLPSGKVTLSLGGVSMVGTVDPRSSGTFGPTGKVRVVAGGGGWDQAVPAQDFTNDGGITSTLVYQQTASLVRETVNDLAPATLGSKWERIGGPASRVFRDAPWWLDLAGVTQVGAPRPAATADGSLVIHEWDPTRQRIVFSCDTLLLPNTQLTDARFNGANPVIYDVEQTFDANGSIGWGWATVSACSQLVADLKSATLEWTRAAYRTLYRYRLVQNQGSRYALQAVSKGLGVPDLIPVVPWSGLAGLSTQLANAQEVLVGFENADPGLPRIVAYSLAGTPLSSTLDATASVKIGPSAASVAIAGGANPVVPTPWATALELALAAFVATLTTPPVTTVAQIVAAAGTLATALGALPSDATQRVTLT
jgi:hypothetical protein